MNTDTIFDTFNHSYGEKSLNRGTYMAEIYYYDPQSAGINLQSPQSATTPRRLTLKTGQIQTQLLSNSDQLNCSCRQQFQLIELTQSGGLKTGKMF